MTNDHKHDSILDNREKINKIDPDGALKSAESLADQIKQVWDEQDQLKVENIKDIENIVVAGMGGSSLGADVIKNLYKEELKVPFILNRSYSLPAFVNEKTLVILSSYSGNTEEVIACSKEAKEKKAQIIVLTAGGQLQELAKKENYPAFIINPKNNPSGQPRMAVGYSIMAQIVLLKKLGLIEFGETELKQIIDAINLTTESCLVEVEQDNNHAKVLAFMSVERRPILTGADFLEGALHTATNQFNENAKIFADYKVIPELNHHLLEGLAFPKSNPLNHVFLFFQSQLYHPRIQKRVKLTAEAVEKAGIETLTINLVTENKLMQIFELITLSTFSNLYLSYLENNNPCPIPTVDWFKNEMKK